VRFKNLQGDFAFKVLYKTSTSKLYEQDGVSYCAQIYSWYISDGYFFSQKEIKECYGEQEVVWPVEVVEGNVVRVMDQEELE
jgi:hypothetical protein